MKRYLLFASHAYAYSILRPLEAEILRRGDEVAWFLEDTCPMMLNDNERRLTSINSVMKYNPIAVFACGNWIYDFFPGVKVAVFHGYPSRKRIEKIDDHFTIRGWFDIYCTQGPTSTPYFKELEEKHKFFKVYETGWCKVDPFFTESSESEIKEKNDVPTILYSPTFTKGISSAWDLLPTIKELADTKPWKWIITFHPKLDDQWLIDQYTKIASEMPNVNFTRHNDGLPTFRKADIMLCDSSSIVIEFMLLDKPVVTYRNTHPGPFLLDVTKTEEIGPAIEKALTRPDDLMDSVREYTNGHEAHRDGHNSARVIDAVDDYIQNYKGKLKSKPLNLIRKLKLRWKLKYWAKL